MAWGTMAGGACGGLRTIGTRAEERGSLGEVDGVGDAEHVVLVNHHLPPPRPTKQERLTCRVELAHRVGVKACIDLLTDWE